MASASDGLFKFLTYQLPTPLRIDWRTGLVLAAPVIPISKRMLKSNLVDLAVVTCLSQRLSHACLSISFYTAKLRSAHESSYTF